MSLSDPVANDLTLAAVPHVAMIMPHHSPDAKPRESIELRLLVWNEE